MTNEDKTWTPGPLIAGPNVEGHYSIWEGDEVGDVVGTAWKEADAKLWAKAPEMATLLRRIWESAAYGVSGHIPEKWLNQAKAILATLEVSGE